MSSLNSPTYDNQTSFIYCLVSVCYLCFNLGIIYAWPSSTLKLFSSATNTTLNRVMTETELALLGSLPSIAALVTTPLSGFLLDMVGRKYSCMLFALPQVVSIFLKLLFEVLGFSAFYHLTKKSLD